MAAGQENNDYFKMLSSGYVDDESSVYSESSEEEVTDSSDDEIQVPGGESDDNMDDIDLNISAGFDPTYKPVWTTTPPQFGVDRLNFTGTPGVNNNFVTSEVPLDAFENMFTDEICTYIVEMSNKFAERTMSGKTLKPNSRMRWVPLTMADMKVYAAIVLYQGIIWKPTYEVLHNRHIIFHTWFEKLYVIQ